MNPFPEFSAEWWAVVISNWTVGDWLAVLLACACLLVLAFCIVYSTVRGIVRFVAREWKRETERKP